MSTLFLHKGGRLELTRWETREGSTPPGHRVEEDVSTQAGRFLFEPLEIAPEVTLRDAFLVIRANPSIQPVLGGEIAANLTAEALSSDPGTPVAPDADIEYLEIYRLWERDTRAGRTRGTERARLHGVSPQLPEKIDDEAWTSLHGGTRRHVPIAFSSPMVLVDLPLRINPLVIVAEADPSASRCGHVLEEVLAPDVTLGQVLHAIVSDLTTHGRPALREAAQADPVDAALART